jgi:hypothetical protein
MENITGVLPTLVNNLQLLKAHLEGFPSMCQTLALITHTTIINNNNKGKGVSSVKRIGNGIFSC